MHQLLVDTELSMQMLSGVQAWVYWLSIVLWDALFFALLTAAVIGVLFAFDVSVGILR